MNCTAHGRPWCFGQDCVEERRRAVAARTAVSKAGAAISDDVMQRLIQAQELRIHGATLGFDDRRFDLRRSSRSAN